MLASSSSNCGGVGKKERKQTLQICILGDTYLWMSTFLNDVYEILTEHFQLVKSNPAQYSRPVTTCIQYTLSAAYTEPDHPAASRTRHLTSSSQDPALISDIVGPSKLSVHAEALIQNARETICIGRRVQLVLKGPLRYRWRGGATGTALDLRSTGRGFKSYSGQSCVTTLDKLFTPMCLCHQAV